MRYLGNYFFDTLPSLFWISASSTSTWSILSDNCIILAEDLHLRHSWRLGHRAGEPDCACWRGGDQSEAGGGGGGAGGGQELHPASCLHQWRESRQECHIVRCDSFWNDNPLKMLGLFIFSEFINVPWRFLAGASLENKPAPTCKPCSNHCMSLNWEGNIISNTNCSQCKGGEPVRLGVTKSQGTSSTPGGPALNTASYQLTQVVFLEEAVQANKIIKLC